jgi:hypothetical protein
LYLSAPRYAGDKVGWVRFNEAGIGQGRVWLFRTHSGAAKARNMHDILAEIVEHHESDFQ